MHSEEEKLESVLLSRLAGAEDAEAANQLLELVLQDMRRIAHSQLRGLPPSFTLRTTALVNEAYVKLAHSESEVQDRDHYLSRAAHAMRTVVIDHVRYNNRLRRRPPGERQPLDHVCAVFEDSCGDLLALEDALQKLDSMAPRAAKMVELRFFADCSMEETAQTLGVSVRSLWRDWDVARAFLQKEMQP